MKELTTSQKKILEFIGTFTDAIGRAPTVAEIRSAFDYSSRTTVYSHLKRLESKGFLERHRPDELNRYSTRLTDPARRILEESDLAGRNIEYSQVGDLVTIPDSHQLLRELVPESEPEDFMYHVGTNKYAAEGLPAGTTVVLRPVEEDLSAVPQAGYGLIETKSTPRFGKYRLAGERIWVDTDARDKHRGDLPVEESPLVAVVVASINVSLWSELSDG